MPPIRMHHICNICSQSFTTLAALRKHWGMLLIRTMCFCRTCGHFFGPDFQCEDPPERKRFNCFMCKIELQFSHLQDHICFHLGRKPYDPKTDRVTNRVARSRALKKDGKLKAAKKRKMNKARKNKYYAKVRRIMNKESLANDSVGEDDEDILMEPEILLHEASDNETDLCMFCSEEIPVRILSKHENNHRVEQQLFAIQHKQKARKAEPEKDDFTICHICGQFVKRSSFRSHKQFHTRLKKTVICEICGFSSKNITQHRISHSDQRKHNCDKCNMSFKTANGLHKHDLVHTEVGQHKCPTCEKSFKAAYNLTVHMRSHMDKKPFECEYCEKTFTTKQWRDNHMKSHR